MQLWDFFLKLICSRVIREQNCHRTINNKTKRVRISRVANKIKNKTSLQITEKLKIETLMQLWNSRWNPKKNFLIFINNIVFLFLAIYCIFNLFWNQQKEGLLKSINKNWSFDFLKILKWKNIKKELTILNI